MRQQTPTRFTVGYTGLHQFSILLAIAAVMTSGCASSSGPVAARGPRTTSVSVAGHQPINITNEAGVGTLALSVAARTAWQALPAAYEQLGIEVAHMNSSIMEIGNSRFSVRRIGRDRMNTFVDCGNDLAGPLANQYAVTLSVSSSIEAKGADSSEVTTLVDAYAEPRAVSGNSIHCQSRSTLEKLINDTLAEVVGNRSG